MTTLRDEDIPTTTNPLPGGDADQSDSDQGQVDPAGVDKAGSDADGSDGSDADGSDSGTDTETEIVVEPRKGDADSSDS